MDTIAPNAEFAALLDKVNIGTATPEEQLQVLQMLTKAVDALEVVIKELDTA